MATSQSKTDLRRAAGRRKWLVRLALALVAASLTIVVWRIASGQGTGLRSLPLAIQSTFRAVAAHDRVTALNSGAYTNIVFLHHSTGDLIIKGSNLRQELTANGFSFWDQGYNRLGLRDPSGDFTGYGYFVPRDNTDPDGLVRIFSQPVYQLPLNTLSGLLQHEVIIVKSCFLPANDITSEEQLAELQSSYTTLRSYFDRYPDKLFILLTTPPVSAAATSPAAAARAMRLAQWLSSDDFVQGHPNLAVFDLYSQLAVSEPGAQNFGTLRAEYTRSATDSHPNRLASELVGKALTEFIVAQTSAFRAARQVP